MQVEQDGWAEDEGYILEQGGDVLDLGVPSERIPTFKIIWNRWVPPDPLFRDFWINLPTKSSICLACHGNWKFSSWSWSLNHMKTSSEPVPYSVLIRFYDTTFSKKSVHTRISCIRELTVVSVPNGTQQVQHMSLHRSTECMLTKEILKGERRVQCGLRPASWGTYFLSSAHRLARHQK